LKKIKLNWGTMAMALSLFVIFPAECLFSNPLPGIGLQEDFALISGKQLTPEGSTFCLSGSLPDLNYNININNAGLLFPGSMDVKICTLPECYSFTSSSLMKYDLNWQSHTDQPGQPFTKDPGGMGGFCFGENYCF
jgi:hypothetical protein